MEIDDPDEVAGAQSNLVTYVEESDEDIIPPTENQLWIW